MESIWLSLLIDILSYAFCMVKKSVQEFTNIKLLLLLFIPLILLLIPSIKATESICNCVHVCLANWYSIKYANAECLCVHTARVILRLFKIYR